jgi:3-isopropylmalate dehydratase small subunit
VPCLTLDFSQVDEIQRMIEGDPGCLLELDVENRGVRAGENTYPAGLPDGVQRAFLEGLWDSAILLLEASAAIDEVNARILPLQERS